MTEDQREMIVAKAREADRDDYASWAAALRAALADVDTAAGLLREARASVEEVELAGYKVGPLLERIDAFLAGRPAPKPAESEARMLRKCLARVRATIDSDEELKARYVAAAAKMPLEAGQPAPDGPCPLCGAPKLGPGETWLKLFPPQPSPPFVMPQE